MGQNSDLLIELSHIKDSDEVDYDNPLAGVFWRDFDASYEGENISLNFTINVNNLPNPYQNGDEKQMPSEFTTYLKNRIAKYII